MTWRIISISNTSKLDLRPNNMVVRGETTTKVHLSEISLLIIENTAVSLTAALLCELNKRKIKVVFCDEKRNPYGELISYYGCHDCVDKLRQQIKWDSYNKSIVWAEIVREKITNQCNLLARYGHEQTSLLSSYIDNIEPNDASNREGHAAKVYFNCIFGEGFSRRQDNVINACLNYGYSIILSAINRESVALGYCTQLGIFHDNVFNQFNLGSDLIEPFRSLVDRNVLEINPLELNTETKLKLVDILNTEVMIDSKKNYLNNALKIYCKSVLDAVSNGEAAGIKFCNYEA